MMEPLEPSLLWSLTEASHQSRILDSSTISTLAAKVTDREVIWFYTERFYMRMLTITGLIAECALLQGGSSSTLEYFPGFSQIKLLAFVYRMVLS